MYRLPAFQVILLMVLALLPLLVQGQSTEYKNGVAVRGLLIDASDYAGDLDADLQPGFELAYSRNLASFLNVEVPLFLGNIQVPSTDGLSLENNLIFGGDVQVKLQYFKSAHRLVPYLFGGIGGMGNENGDFSAQSPLGLGLDIQLNPKTYLQIQAARRISLQDEPDINLAKLGVLFLLGKKSTPKQPQMTLPADRDKDGLSDDQDQCPDEAGPIPLYGCPDLDGDGVADKDDSCPDVVGLAEFSGCPDTDGDGLADPEDDCPELVGDVDNRGCPNQDTDGDGLQDKEDDCPELAGLAELKGCPDKDGDQIPDHLDDCPERPGLARYLGCPDTDGDLVPDPTDDCPNRPGPVASNGCPDIEEGDKALLEEAMQAVQFEEGKAAIKGSSYDVLDQIVALLNKYTAYSMSIEGHTDSIGSYDNNQRLSEKRAKACRDYLVLKGISKSRLDYVGYGESRPIANNKYKDGRSKNRRVEFKLYLK
ncbi:MAG: OmpA family protein [Bacteroidota bacterium]